MSRRTSSGSRFEALTIESEGDGSDSESSTEEMKLSKDFYRATIPGAQVSPGTLSSASSTEEMKLSRDFYTTAQSTLEPSTSSAQITKGISTGSSGSKRHIKPRTSRSTPVPTEEPTDIEFNWDHYNREGNTFDDVPETDQLFAQSSQGSQQQQYIPTASIEDDIPVLKEIGFNIEYPDGLLGAGFYGSVYRGHYGTGAPHLASSRFAVKIMDFGSKPNYQIKDMREMFETEKFILTHANHKNIVCIRMIINMGGMSSIPFRNTPNITFLSPQRIYIIMDYADGGELDKWLDKNNNKMEPAQRINLIRDLFFGMDYLHQQNIIHGDVHTGNILLFTENGELVAKWADFGLGYVGSDRQYRFRPPESFNMNEKLKEDIYNMGSVFSAIMRGRPKCRPETQQEMTIMEQFMKMIKEMRKDKFTSLTEVYHKYRSILEDEIKF